METAAEVRRRGPGRPPKTRAETSRIKIRTAANRFDIDEDRIPDEMSYQWIAKTVIGKDNQEELIAMQQNGWTPVPAGRHPELTGAKPDDETPIVRGGQMLHERPKHITDMVREDEAIAAAEQMDTQLERVAAKSRSAGGARGTRIAKRVVAISEEAD